MRSTACIVFSPTMVDKCFRVIRRRFPIESSKVVFMFPLRFVRSVFVRVLLRDVLSCHSNLIGRTVSHSCGLS